MKASVRWFQKSLVTDTVTGATGPSRKRPARVGPADVRHGAKQVSAESLLTEGPKDSEISAGQKPASRTSHLI